MRNELVRVWPAVFFGPLLRPRLWLRGRFRRALRKLGPLSTLGQVHANIEPAGDGLAVQHGLPLARRNEFGQIWAGEGLAAPLAPRLRRLCSISRAALARGRPIRARLHRDESVCRLRVPPRRRRHTSRCQAEHKHNGEHGDAHPASSPGGRSLGPGREWGGRHVALANRFASPLRFGRHVAVASLAAV